MTTNEFDISCYSEDKTIFYTALLPDRIEEALQTMEKSFYDNEPLCSSYGVSSNRTAVMELNHLCRLVAREGKSLVAIDVATDKIIGSVFNKLQEIDKPGEESFFENFTRTHCTAEESTAIMNSMKESDEVANVFEIYGAVKLMEIVFLTVSPDYGQKKVGFHLVKYSLDLLNKLARQPNGPTLATSMLTSKFSTRIAQSLKFDIVATIPFDKFVFRGVKSSQKIDPIHEVVSMVAKRAIISD